MPAFGLLSILLALTMLPSTRGTAHSVTWAVQSYSQLSIELGDSVTFSWAGDHGVALVSSESDWTNCAVGSSSALASSSAGGDYTFHPASIGTFYFVSTDAGNCGGGQKVKVVVGDSGTCPISTGVTEYVECFPEQMDALVQAGLCTKDPSCGRIACDGLTMAELLARCAADAANPLVCDPNAPSSTWHWSSCGPTPTSQPAGFPYAVPEGTPVLPRSTQTQLLTLRRFSATDCSAVVVARSYGGRAWEAVNPAPLQPTCTAQGDCSIEVCPNQAGTYRVDAIEVSEVPTAEEAAARVLIQTTFGPTKSDLQNFLSTYSVGGALQATAVKDWIDAQVAVPPTLHRAYYRQRTNPSVRNTAIEKASRGPCESGSQWRKLSAAPSAAAGQKQVFESGDLTVATLPYDQDALVVQYFAVHCTVEVLNGEAYISYDGTWYKFEPRFKLLENTLEAPIREPFSTGYENCPNVPKTFVNEQWCRRHDTACSAPTFSNAQFALDAATLQKWYSLSSKHVHYVTGLRLESPFDVSPCAGQASRWRRSAGACPSPTSLDGTTLAALESALRQSADTNPHVRDITVLTASCSSASPSGSVGAKVTVDGECFEHVHPDLYGVFDMSYWTTRHPGNAVAAANGRPNPIANFAVLGQAEFVFPSSHGMDRWADNRKSIYGVGARLDDSIGFNSLSPDLQTTEIAKLVGAVSPGATDGFEACGSPGEVANDPALGHHYYFTSSDVKSDDAVAKEYTAREGKAYVWYNVALTAPDQLRQRVAWALSQILITAENAAGGEEWTEVWAHYYDHFVRHAFGNYRDLLREVAYSPMMGKYLTYERNKAYRFEKTWPDENFAREIMQLFTVGLWQLHPNGTRRLDGQGRPIPTYDNDDIVAFARVWTGLSRQASRGNYDLPTSSYPNLLDPMFIKMLWKDLLPKTDLEGGYLGDGYPLCAELPAHHFLSKGARFRYTGRTSDEGAIFDTDAEGAFRGRFTPAAATSALHAALCGYDADLGHCSWPADVVLPSTLPCDGVECDAEDVRVVKMVDAATNEVVYYTYLPPPCVRLALFEGRVTRVTSSVRYQCSDPALPSFGNLCCNSESPPRPASSLGGECLFVAERMRFATAQARCQTQGLAVCAENHRNVPNGDERWERMCAAKQYYWLDSPCSLQVQVHSNGYVGIVDPKTPDAATCSYCKYEEQFIADTLNLMSVRWEAGSVLPTAAAGCPSGCTARLDTCLCDITVQTAAVFTDPTDVPTLAAVEARLPIGAAAIDTFAAGVYTKCVTVACAAATDVEVYTRVQANGAWDADTIFKLPPGKAGGPVRYRLNRLSTILVGTAGTASFRNPPGFLRHVGGALAPPAEDGFPESFDVPLAENEIEALLDHLVDHPSTAPFVAHKLIQRLVTSNPSPRYVEAVVTAFRTGAYDGQTFSGGA